MTRINSTKPITSQRVHASFVERNRMIIDRASPINPVNPIDPVQNNINYSSANHLFTSDLFYDKLQKLKKDYLDFYNNERNLHKEIDEMSLDEEIQLELLKNLLDKYNKAIMSLSQLDQQLGTKNAKNIMDIILEYNNHLNDLGIYIVEDMELKIDEEKYKNNLIDSKNARKSLFKPIRHMIVLIYREFRNIKGSYNEDSDNGYAEIPLEDRSGIVLDSRS